MLKFCMRILFLFILNFYFSSTSLWAACTPEMDADIEYAGKWCEAVAIMNHTSQCTGDNLGGAYPLRFQFGGDTTGHWYFGCQNIKCNGELGWIDIWNYNPNGNSGYPASCNPNDTNIPPIPPPTIIAINNTNSCTRSGSIIQTSNQVIGETISLVGVPFYLTHFSSRVTGRLGEYKMLVPLSSSAISNSISGFNITVSNEQNNIIASNSLSAIPNQIFSYQWNGKENEVETWGGARVNVIIKTLSNSTPVADRSLYMGLGNFKAKKLGIGGWIPSIWHFYDSVAEKIYDGDGNSRNVKAVKEGIYNRVANADGSEVYYFDSIGRLALTRTGLTGALLYSFGYDQATQKLLNITDTFSNAIRFKYDDNGNLAQIVSAENIKTNFTVDQNGYLKSVTNPNNEIYSMTYKDAGGLLSSFTKPNGVRSLFTYDENGNLLTDVNSGGQSSTLLKTEIGINAVSALGRVTQNNYDAATNSEIEIRPSGLATTYVHAPDLESVSNVISVTKSNIVNDSRFGAQVRNYSQTETTNFGTTITNVEDAVDLNDLTNPFSVSTLTKSVAEGSSELISHYDGLTRTNTLTTKLGRSIATQLDRLERPILEQAGNTLPKKYTYQNDLLTKIIQGDREIELAYNPNTKLLSSVKNSENQEVSFYYDQAQRLSAKRLPDGRVINFQYDSNNNLVSITPSGRPAHKLNYGATEQLSSYVPPDLEGVNNVSTLYSNSIDKELTKITRPDGQVINFNYDLTSGLLSTITGSFGVISREYQNELVTKITDQNNQVARLGYTGSVVSSLTITDSNQNTVYNYQRVSSASASGRVGSETISAGSKSQSIGYSYDDDKFLSKAGDLNLEYNSPNGQLVKTNLDNIVEHYTYNKVGEVKSYKASIVLNNNEKLLYGYRLERDKLGRIIKKLEKFAEDDKKHLHGYVYDRAGRLIHVHGHRRNSNYNYDLNSNRIHGHAGDSEFNAIYDNQDRLIRFNKTIFSYNPNGELLSKSEQIKCDKDDDKKKNKALSYVNTAFIYDVFGNLKQAGKVSYQIDPLQRRSARLVNGVVTNRYAYNPEGQLAGELDAQGNLLKTFVYASKSHVPDYFIDQNNVRYKLIVDQLGSVRLVVNASSGEIKEKMIHDEFGKVLVDTNPGYTPLGFAGGIYDSETKLVRFGARDYNSEIGRWTSKDPIRFNGGDSNLYGYTFNDPVNFVDPSGLSSIAFNRGAGTITISDRNGNPIGTFPAGNNTASSSNGPWPNGTYSYTHHTAHPESGPSGPYGSNGNFVFNVPGRTGMGVHSGRRGPSSNTLGCIRTTDQATSILGNLNTTDPLTSITIGN